jgi:hypothetical protein
VAEPLPEPLPTGRLAPPPLPPPFRKGALLGRDSLPPALEVDVTERPELDWRGTSRSPPRPISSRVGDTPAFSPSDGEPAARGKDLLDDFSYTMRRPPSPSPSPPDLLPVRLLPSRAALSAREEEDLLLSRLALAGLVFRLPLPLPPPPPITPAAASGELALPAADDSCRSTFPPPSAPPFHLPEFRAA